MPCVALPKHWHCYWLRSNHNQRTTTMWSRFLVPVSVQLLLIATCIWIILYNIQPGPRDHLGIGFMLGSLFGHSTLASGWVVFGPGGWLRLPLAFVWLLAIPCACSLHTIIFPNSPDSGIIWLSGFFVMAIVQVLAWPLRYWRRLRICRPVQANDVTEERVPSHQFGIRELMILTTIVAVFIAGGRLILPHLLRRLGSGEAAIFAFLIVASIIICIPVTFSILAMRRPVIPTLMLLVFVAVVTYIELPLLSSLGLPRGGPDRLHLILINVFSILPVVIVCVILRLAGYQLSAISRE